MTTSRTPALSEQEPLDGSTERSDECARSGVFRSFLPARVRGAHVAGEPCGLIEGAPRWESARLEKPLDPFGDGVEIDTSPAARSSNSRGCHQHNECHATPGGVNDNLSAAGADGVSPDEKAVQDRGVASAQKKDESPIARRIRAYVTENGMSLRALSAQAGLNPSQLGGMIIRLNNGARIDAELLDAVARAMGHSLTWLLTGEEDQLLRLCDAPGWADAVREARETYPHLDPDTIDLVGQIRAPKAPRVDAPLVVALVLGWTRK